MKKLNLIFCLLLIATISTFAQQTEFPKLTGPYLGQKPPGMTPELFAQGIVSTELHEFSCCFSPDGNEFYFSRRHPQLNYPVLMFSKAVDGVWTKPEIALFVEEQFSFEPWITPDNKRLYFQSGKPIAGQAGPPMNVLYVEREKDGWSEVKNPGAPFNPAKAMHISSTLDGTIYTTDISMGPGTECLGIIKNVNGEYKTLKKLDAPLNTEKLSQHPWIAPDESYIIYTVRRPGQKVVGVLYYSQKKKDGSWSEPKEINLGMSAGQPYITSDGKYLFFTNMTQNTGDLYWVSTKIIEELRRRE